LTTGKIEVDAMGEVEGEGEAEAAEGDMLTAATVVATEVVAMVVEAQQEGQSMVVVTMRRQRWAMGMRGGGVWWEGRTGRQGKRQSGRTVTSGGYAWC
jgi:hypothetical protein